MRTTAWITAISSHYSGAICGCGVCELTDLTPGSNDFVSATRQFNSEDV
jgi:hypothetical protein